MQSVVVDVAEDSAGTDTIGAILGVDELAETVHDHSAVLPLALLLVLLGLNSRQRHTTHLLMNSQRWLLSSRQETVYIETHPLTNTLPLYTLLWLTFLHLGYYSSLVISY